MSKERIVTVEVPESIARAFVDEVSRELGMRASVYPRHNLPAETIEKRNKPLATVAKLVREKLPPPPAQQGDFLPKE